MVVRELVAMFGIDFNPAGAKKAESAMDGLKSMAGKLGIALSAGAIAKGLYSVVEMAAAASENLSLLKVTFGQSSDSVLAWADANSRALGRSKFSLREYVGAIGVVTKGLTGSEKDAATVGKSFAQLAVDLKAYFDLASDEDALNALRSGLTGETEPLKKFGIVMDEAGLAAFALQKGHKTLWKDMAAAEKTMVRYAFVMQSATAKDVFGAASREAGSFGNRIAALKDRFKELATQIGGAFLPMAQKLLDLFDDYEPHIRAVANIIGDLASKTYFFEWIAGIAAARGGLALINMLIQLYRVIRTRVLLSLVSTFMNLATLTAWLGTATTATWAFIVAWAPVAAVVAAVLLLGAAVYALWQQFTTGTNFIAEFLEDWIGLESDIATGLGIIDEWFTKTWSEISAYVSDALEKIRAKIAGVLPKGVLNFLAKVGVDLRGADAAAKARTGAGQTAAPGTTVASRSVSVTNGAVNVTIQGNATPGTAQQVGKEVQKALDNNNRTLAATAPAAPV
jgi:hypothetical protein